MLSWVRLRNFRGFDDHKIDFRKTTIAVGRNNAGKSSIIEALRLVAIATNRYMSLSYRPAPDWLDDITGLPGASIDVANLQIDFDSICYEYRPAPAEIEAQFADGKKIHIFLSPERKIHTVLFDRRGRAVRTKSEARSLGFPKVGILPQISPLAREEKVLRPETVLGAIDSPLSSSHFRNQLLIQQNYYDGFCELAEEKWPGLQVRDLVCERGYPGDPIFLEIRCDEFVGEVGKMGHGLQMWLQCIWFLTRCKDFGTIILDEPDVYMHADLQRRLIRHLLLQDCQVIVATHSVEILSEVEPEDILIIERKRKESRFADSLPSVQKIMEFVGSIHNVHFARLWSSKRFLLVEGEDIRFLKRLHRTLFPFSISSLEAIPNISIGGWNGWSWAIGSSMAMKNAFGESLTTYCILDSDYHLDEEIKERYRQAKDRGIQLHVWKRKELENYLIHPAAVARIINDKNKKGVVKQSDVEIKISEIIDKIKDDALDGFTDELHRSGYKGGGALKKARILMDQRSDAKRGLLDVVCGKDVISKLSLWAHANYGATISVVALANELRSEEIDKEVCEVLLAIEQTQTFK